jgi:hypothetical protein
MLKLKGMKGIEMKKIVFRGFVDYEKEEVWLNEMSSKGLALTDYFFLRYVFVDSEPGEYIYRIELLNNYPGNPESQKYLSFMKENGVEHIASWYRWVYFRKKVADGTFDIYSDIDSRISHYGRVMKLWLPIIILEICLGVLNLVLGILFLLGNPHHGSMANFTVGLLCLVVGALFISAWERVRQNVKKLKQEKHLRE